MNTKETKKNIIQAGQLAVKELIKVAKDSGVMPVMLEATDAKNFYVRKDKDWENMKGRAVI